MVARRVPKTVSRSTMLVMRFATREVPHLENRIRAIFSRVAPTRVSGVCCQQKACRREVGPASGKAAGMLETEPTTACVTVTWHRRCGVAIVVVASALVMACRPEGSSSHRDQAALVEMQQDLARAWVSGDRTALERIIASEWTTTGPDGRTSDRARVLAQVFETGVHRIHNLKIDDVKARVFGDAAVVTGRTRGVGEFEGAAYDVVIRFTDVFVRRAGQWQAVASHSSLIQASDAGRSARQGAPHDSARLARAPQPRR